MKWNGICGIWGAVAVSMGAWLMNVAFSSSGYGAWRCLVGLVASLCMLSAMLAFHMSIIQCSQSHTLPSLLRSYFRNQLGNLRRSYLKSKLERMWKSPLEAQENLLRELMTRDAGTEYGRRHSLHDIKTLADLQTKHPLTTYEHYKEYIQRLADGGKGVFLATEITRFGITSGTTGAGKLIPHLSSRVNAVIHGMSDVSFPAFESFGQPSPLQKYCIMYCKPTLGSTKSGHVVSPLFFISPKDVEVLDMTTTPPSGFEISSDYEANYVHLLFALGDKNMGIFLAAFTSMLFRAMKFLETNWETLLDDIAKGRIRPELAISDEIRRNLNAALTPDPARAGELRLEFSKGFVGIVSRVWPNLKYIFSIDVGGFQSKVEQNHTKGTPIYAGVYKSTETCVGVNLWAQGQPSKYILYLPDNIFEFIPEDSCQDENSKALLLDEVKCGQNYELVLTTRGGLWRYRNGDVVEVVGFHDKCPVIQFKYRLAELLNLRGEKVTAVAMQAALEQFMHWLQGASLMNWTTAESSLLADDSFEIFYIVFLELGDDSHLEDTSQWAPKLDEVLRKTHHAYSNVRTSGTLSMARVYQVKAGSFQKLKEFIVANTSASANQFKSPRKLRKRNHLELMMSYVLSPKP